jgi:hypothetical protein
MTRFGRRRFGKLVLGSGVAATLGAAVKGEARASTTARKQAQDDALIAIDVPLEPDEAMMQYAIAINARLLDDFPQGFPLGTEQVPHVTLVQLYVAASDLPQVKSAVADALSAGNSLIGRQLTATGIDSAVLGSIGLAALTVDGTPELLDLHERVVQAVKPFARQDGTSAAFSTSTSLPNVPTDSWIVDYVQTFIPNQSGEHFDPHITLGIASAAFVKQLEAEQFPGAVHGRGHRRAPPRSERHRPRGPRTVPVAILERWQCQAGPVDVRATSD